jgi:hypothetical protein
MSRPKHGPGLAALAVAPLLALTVAGMALRMDTARDTMIERSIRHRGRPGRWEKTSLHSTDDEEA